jgi:hypothetical protein
MDRLNGYGLTSFVIVIYINSYIPKLLQSFDADSWPNSQYLKKTFTRRPNGKNKTTNLIFLAGLLCAASTLRDRVIRVNYWLNLSKDSQSLHQDCFKTHLLHPTMNASPLPLFSSAAGTAIAE